MPDRTIPYNYIVFPFREILRNGIQEMILDIFSSIIPQGRMNCRGFNIDAIDMITFYGEETFCKKAIAAPNIQQCIAFLNDLRSEKTSVIGIGPINFFP